MNCEICGQGPRQGTSVYRTGEKGAGHNPHWRCQFHMTTEQREAVPNDAAVIVALVERANEKEPRNG